VAHLEVPLLVFAIKNFFNFLIFLALIFAELKQYELMKAQVNESSEQRHDCEKCILYSCQCSECNRMDLERLLNQT
jgi:hypothetical protein